MRSGEGAANLLLVDNGRDRRAEEDHAAHVRDVDSLVQHVYAEEELQVIRGICLEVRESPVGLGVFGIGGIDMRMFIHLIKPVGYTADHVAHMLGIGAEDQVLPCPVGHVPVEDILQAFGQIQGAAQLLQDLFRGVAGGPALRMTGAELVLRKVVFILENRENILRCRKDAADDGFAEAHLRGDAAVEELLGHVALRIEVTDRCGREAKDCCGRAHLQ